MGYLADTKEIILALKNVYKEQKLSIDKVLAMVDAKEGEGKVSRSTIQRLFAPGSEDDPSSFRYETTLIPICNTLLDENSTNTTIMMRYKRDLIEDFVNQNKELKEEIRSLKESEEKKYNAKLEAHTNNFQNTLNFVNHQIELKDQRIDALLAMNTELMQTNNELLKQLMDCPYRNEH